MANIVVVDCSVAVKWVLSESNRVEALYLLDEERLGNISLIAPDLLLAEAASLVAKRTRRKQLSDAQAHQAFRLLEHSVLRLFETRPLLPAALDLASRNQMSLWDCVYIALAMEYGCPLVTADRRLFRGYSPRHPAIRLLA